MLTKDDIEQLKDEMRQVPFGNSQFQVRHFTPGGEGPERRYRNCLLQINRKLQALQECEFRRQRLEIDMEEIASRLSEDMKWDRMSVFDERRARIDLDEKQYALNTEVKLIEDALIEIEVYRDELSRLPKFSRDEFERGEKQYWINRLLGDAQRQMISMGHVEIGTMQSLQQIGIIGVGMNDSGQLQYHQIKQEEDSNEHVLESNA